MSQRKKPHLVRLKPKIFLEWVCRPELNRSVQERFGSGEREGVPKGEPIGPSHGKFIAALNLLFLGSKACRTLAHVVLYPMPITDTVRRRHVNTNVLRVWRAQANFQELFSFLLWDFAEFFVGQIPSTFASGAQPIDEMIKEFSAYGVVLQQAIMTLLKEAFPCAVPELPVIEQSKWRRELNMVMKKRPSAPIYSNNTLLILFFLGLLSDPSQPINSLNITAEDRLRIVHWLCSLQSLFVTQQAKMIRLAICNDNKEEALQELQMLETLGGHSSEMQIHSLFSKDVFQRN